MIADALAGISVVLLLALACSGFLRKKPSAPAPLVFLSLLLAGIELCGRTALRADTGYPAWWRAGTVMEALLPASVLWYSFSFARSEPVRGRSLKGGALAGLALLAPAAALLFLDSFPNAPDFQTARTLLLGSGEYWFYLGLMLSCIAAIINIEGTFRSTPERERWKIKFEVIGMIAVLAVLIFHFSQALLYGTIDAKMLPARSVVLSLGAGLVLSSRILRRTGVRVSVSRYLFYRSATLVVVGAYLIVLGLVGEGMKYFEAPLGRYLAVLAAFGAGILLLAALLSAKLRRRIKVSVSKHCFAQKHDYRQTWLDLTDRLAACTALSELERAIPAAYTGILGLQAASLYRLHPGSGRYVPAKDGNSRARCFPATPGLLAYFQERNRIWNVSDGEYAASEDERSFVSAEKALLVVPLLCKGQVEGLVVLGNPDTGQQFTYEDYDLIKTIAQQCALLLSNLRLSEELIEAREFAATARVSSFVVHDLKNLTHILSLMTDNAEQQIGNLEFQRDMIGTIRNTLGNMKKLTQKLKALPEGGGRKNRENTDLLGLAREVVAEFAKARPGGAVILTGGGEAVCAADTEELRKVIVNLVQNGLDAAGETGRVTVETGSDNGRAYVRVSDTGCGMPQEFMEQHLFRPFRTTKKAGLGLGLYHCKQITESFGGVVEATSNAGKGSCFTVYVPAPDFGPGDAFPAPPARRCGGLLFAPSDAAAQITRAPAVLLPAQPQAACPRQAADGLLAPGGGRKSSGS